MRSFIVLTLLLACGGTTDAARTQCDLIDWDASIPMVCELGQTCIAPLDDPAHPGAGGLCR
jgi:hypothetical protein